MKRIFVLVMSAVVLSVSGCATVYNPATGNKEYIMIDTQQEVSIGKQVSAELEAKYPLSNDAAQTARVEAIGRKIAAVSDRKDLTYHFKALKNEDVNALSAPGGYVYVNTGLIEKADDDELAAVIAHEVGHIAARHSVQAIQANMATSLISALVFSQVKTKKEVQQASALAVNVIMLGYSRDDEFEADKLGVRYAYYAGFDPDGMASFLEKMQKENRENPFDKALVYLRSHPLYSERIEKVRAYSAYLKHISAQPQTEPAP